MADENAPVVAEQKTLESLGVSQELQDSAKLMWIISGVATFWGPLIFGYIVKKEGQGESGWYQDQVKKCWMVAIISFVGSFCGIGWFFGIYLGFLGMSQIGEGKDPKVMLVSGNGYEGS